MARLLAIWNARSASTRLTFPDTALQRHAEFMAAPSLVAWPVHSRHQENALFAPNGVASCSGQSSLIVPALMPRRSQAEAKR